MLLRFLTAGLLALSLQARAQSPLVPQKAKLDECYRVLGPDSVGFFYTADYVLSPPGCATIRRHTHLDSAGGFRGYVRDYRLDNNQLVLKGSYRNGRKEGVFELYHATGELAARGRYQQGRQVGDWAYWYPSGNKRQILSFGAGFAPAVQQFWDESGQQLVTNGTGTWYRDEDRMRLKGKVVNGYPDGRWELRYQSAPYERVAVEVYAKGQFRRGLVTANLEAYSDAPRMSVADFDAYTDAEQFRLGWVCPSARSADK